MSGYRGKKRKVLEVLTQERRHTDDGTHGHYRYSVRLECGHVVKAMARARYRKEALPVVGYCTQCAAMEVAA